MITFPGTLLKTISKFQATINKFNPSQYHDWNPLENTGLTKLSFNSSHICYIRTCIWENV